MNDQNLFELKRPDFTQIISLFERGNPNEAVLYSTLEGRYPGRVFTDDTLCPTQAFAASGFGWGFFGGRISDEFIANCLNVCPGHIICQYDSGPVLNLPAIYSEVYQRLEFRESTLYEGRSLVGGLNCDFREITEEILDKCLWKDVVLSATATVKNFFDHGIGIVLTRNGKIACEAYGLFTTSKLIEIGAITRPEFRHQGFCTKTVSELIRRCQCQGLATTWTCDLDNVASQSVARKMAYQKCTPYKFIGRRP